MAKKKTCSREVKELLSVLKEVQGFVGNSDVAYLWSHEKGEQAPYHAMLNRLHEAILKAEKECGER